MMALNKVETCNMFWGIKSFLNKKQRRATDYNLVRRMRIACWKTQAADTPS